MARQGSLCHQDHSARWIHTASRWTSSLVWLGLVVAFALTTARTSAFADDQSTPVASESFGVRSANQTIFYAPESAIKYTASVASLTQHASRRLNIRATLLRARDGEVISTNRQILPIDSSGNCDPIDLEFAAPSEPGVYEVRFELASDDETLWGRIRKSKPPILRIGRPIFVVRGASTTVSVNGPESFRSTLIHLPNMDWVQILIDSQPYRPSSDEDFSSECDPLTQQAMKLWTATERLQDFIQSSGLTGVSLTGDYSGESLLVELVGSVDTTPLETLVNVLGSHEIQVQVGSAESQTVVDLRKIRRGALPASELMPSREELAIASALSNSDSAVLILDTPIEVGPLGKPAQEMLRTLAATPTNKLAVVPPVDPANTTVQVRIGTDAGYRYLWLLSLAPWTSEVDLEFSAKLGWNVIGDASSIPVVRQTDVPSSHLRLTLQPGQLLLLKSADQTPDVSIRSWSTVVSGGSTEVERIKRDVTLIVERIGLLTDMESADSLSNGGFEKTGGIGLVGWMHAQHPPGCVKIDDTESIEGNNSVLMTTDPAISARTWIVSETLAPSETGRLAVSLVMRAERQEDAPPHPMRVSIEATRNGEPIRYSGDFDVPRNGQWGLRQIVLEIDGVQKQSVDSLRLTIDSLAGGRVWLDDVRIHHRFPTAKERDELQSQSFLAVQGLQHGNLTPSARLLQNRWARYLLSLGPAKEAKPIVENVAPVKPPGVAERIRSWLPRPIRF